MAEKTMITKNTPPDVIERDIASTRKELSETIDQIQEKFSAEHWKAVAGETVREKADIAAAWGKELADRAGESMRKFSRAARETSLKARGRVVEFIKNNPSAARMIGFELGVLAVIAFESLWKRKSAIRREAGRADYAKAKVISIDDVAQKVKQAALTPEEEFKKAA